jgi:hypothetical protein
MRDRHKTFKVKVDGNIKQRLYLDSMVLAEFIFNEKMSEDDKLLLSFGMINKPIVDSLEGVLAEKFDEIIEEKYEMKPDDIDKRLAELGLGEYSNVCKLREEFVKQVSVDVTRHLYSVAKTAGIMVV